MDSSDKAQLEVCTRYRAEPFPTPGSLKVGIAWNVRDGVHPLSGLRCRPLGDTSGWYIWAGEEWSDDPDFFAPLHIKHLTEWCPAVIPFLLLPPGWRFLIADRYEDVWFDAELLTRVGAESAATFTETSQQEMRFSSIG
jgi:hypothetical protein